MYYMDGTTVRNTRFCIEKLGIIFNIFLNDPTQTCSNISINYAIVCVEILIGSDNK